MNEPLLTPRSYGTATDAIDFALDVIATNFEREDFLKGWRAGDLPNWPEYFDWLQARQGGEQ